MTAVAEIGICRNLGGSAWLLMQKRAGKWKMACPPFGPLSAVVTAALEELKALTDADFSFSDRRLNEEFLVHPFPETTVELTWITNTSITVMAPDPGPDPIWRSLVKDYYGDFSLGSQRFRTQELATEVDKWFRDPHLGGGFHTFNKADALPFNRELACRRSWRLRNIVAPELFDTRAMAS
jgi:hypothetical protein